MPPSSSISAPSSVTAAVALHRGEEYHRCQLPHLEQFPPMLPTTPMNVQSLVLQEIVPVHSRACVSMSCISVMTCGMVQRNVPGLYATGSIPRPSSGLAYPCAARFVTFAAGGCTAVPCTSSGLNSGLAPLLLCFLRAALTLAASAGLACFAGLFITPS